MGTPLGYAAAMKIIRAQVVLNRRSLIPRDAVTNVWDFIAGEFAPTEDLQAVRDALVAFYVGIGNRLANTLSTSPNVNRIKVWHMGDLSNFAEISAIQGPPNLDSTWTLTAVGANAAPAELAATLTLEAGSRLVPEEIGNTRPAARRRGRKYLGPLSLSAFSADATNEMLIDNVVRDEILADASAMATTLRNLTNPIVPAVLSKTAQDARALTAFSMDNAPDVVRSRGVRATNRVRVDLPSVALAS